MGSFQEECNEILDDPNLLEEDQVDKLEELVSAKYPNSNSSQIEKIIMDIMWKHKDPTKVSNRPKVVKIEERVVGFDLPSLEKRLELEKQFLELESQKNKRIPANQTNVVKNEVADKTDSEYQELLEKINSLRIELYGNQEAKTNQSIKISPIDQINEWFNGQVSKSRVEQALKSTGYNVIDAADLIISQLKRKQNEIIDTSADKNSSAFFQDANKSKVMCSFFVKNGSCLRSDCKFSHDVDSRTCRYWINGFCHSGDSCMFKHELPTSSPTSSPSLPTVVTTTMTSTTRTVEPISTPAPRNFNNIPTFVPSNSTPFVSKIKITKPLTKPKLVPWENPTLNTHFKNYVHHRDLSIKYESQRKKYAQQSTEAWKTNCGGRSKQLSDKANKFEDQAIEELKLADESLYDYSMSTTDELWFELHGYEFNEVIDQLKDIINEINEKYNKNSRNVYLVVPSTNSTEYKKTTKPLTLWLDHEGFRYQLFAYILQYGSIIAIDPWS